jgi:hypothetical protein
VALYDDTGFVSRHEAEEALESARNFIDVIRADITARKPWSEKTGEAVGVGLAQRRSLLG